MKILTVKFTLIFLLCAGAVFAGEPKRLLVASVPVADIRRLPQEGKPGYGHDDLNETQVLYNEILAYRGENAGWYQVEAEEQKEFTHNQAWQGYPGWIKKDKAVFIGEKPEYNIVVRSRVARILEKPLAVSEVLLAVSVGTKFKETGKEGGFYKVGLSGNATGWISENEAARIDASESEDQKRQAIVKEAKLFLGTPYYWGGRGFGAVDCSGLVNLAYRASGIDVPRDAHEQWMAAKPIVDGELKPGDLIFLSKKGDFKSIVHVLLYLAGEDFIEAPGTGKSVLINNFNAKFGLSRAALKKQDFVVSGQKIYFGRLLP
jgi:cell wall-associated NlpC family hydrolase